MKLLFLIFSFIIMFNVNATTCSYKIGNENYSVNFDVDSGKADWRKAYKYDNGDTGYLYNESGSQATKFVIKNASKQNIFSKFNKFGSSADVGTCPVLVSIGNQEYTFIPYDVYLNYFALDVTLECPDCNNDQIMAVDMNGNEIKYNFKSFCDSLTSVRTMVAGHGYYEINESVPLIGYFYYNSDYSGVKNICENYRFGNSGQSYPLKNYLSRYKNDFIVGSSLEEEWMETCPLVTNKNQIGEIRDCLNKKRDNLNEAIDNFNKVCTENEMRAIQSYASGTTSKFFDKHGVSGYLNNEIKLLFNEFTTECGEAADNLYRAVNNAGRVLNAYARQSEINNSMIYLSFESYYLKGFSLLTNINPNVKIEENTCKLISNGLRDIIKEILNALRVGGVILVILLSIVEVYKTVIASDDGASKKMFPLISKRIVALVVILLLPTLVLILLDFLNKYIPVDTSKCVISDLNK